MKKLGIIGWRGMVGSVLHQRMLEENDFEHFEVRFFSSSQKGLPAPSTGERSNPVLADAFDLEALGQQDILLSTQGSDYTEKVQTELRSQGWAGYWIDAASHLRSKPECTLVLDPFNEAQIRAAVKGGKKDFIGPNCTVSLMLMAIGSLFKHDLVESISASTYQAISGAGAPALEKLEQELGEAHFRTQEEGHQPRPQERPSKSFSREGAAIPFAMNVLPWIDSAAEKGQTREEWKAQFETNKILGKRTTIPIESTCVRVPTLRCHAQALTIRLTRKTDLQEIQTLIQGDHQWIDFVPNEPEATLKNLTPHATSNSLRIKVGRLRELQFKDPTISLFTVGDQLLWGAAEPLRRMLLMLRA